MPPSVNPDESTRNLMMTSTFPEGQQLHAPPKGLRRYKILSLIGDGTYGLVYLALNSDTKEKVAIKTMKRKYNSWDEVMDLKEVKSLKKLHHPNVVKLKEVIRENSKLYFVFEYIRGDLLGLMKERHEFPESWIRSVVFQLLQGLAYIHRLGFFHRDLKPENILAAGPDVVKIADFGLAREIRSAPPFTDYVSTRWYRAPEVLLRSTNYSSPIDIWAVGCITCELFTKRPLFPGTSEIDQLYKISSILGTPSRSDWPEGFSLANGMKFKFPVFTSTHLSQVLGARSSARTVSFLYALLAWNPSWRCSAQDALRHAFFRHNNNNNNNNNKGSSSSQELMSSLAIGGLKPPQAADLRSSLRVKKAPSMLPVAEVSPKRTAHFEPNDFSDLVSGVSLSPERKPKSNLAAPSRKLAEKADDELLLPRLRLVSLYPKPDINHNDSKTTFSSNKMLTQSSSLYNNGLHKYYRSLPSFDLPPALLLQQQPQQSGVTEKKATVVHVRTNWAAKYLK